MVSFRKLDHPDTPQHLPRNHRDPISSNEISDIAAKIRASGNENDKMTLEMLLWIDWKVNYLIKMLLKDKESVVFPYEADMVDLSASGAKFETREQVAVGSKLQIQFFLPVLPFNEMVIEGVVCRSRQKETHKGLPPRFEVGMEFTHLKEADQETIFHYVIKRERQIRQAQREEERSAYSASGVQ
ncbi:MAG: PilZ domain-containing protein [Nitrospiria bacterium]